MLKLFPTIDVKPKILEYLISSKWCILIIYLVLYLNSVSPIPKRSLKDPRIVIVGSGASGIAAANKLMSNGFTNIIILEAMNRIGGRIHWVKLGDVMTGDFGGVDLGAEWIHGQEGNIIYEIANPLGLLLPCPDLHKQEFFLSDGSQLNVSSSFFDLYETLFQELPKMNETQLQSYSVLSDIIDERIDKYGLEENLTKTEIQKLKNYAKFDSCTIYGCSELNDVSVKRLGEYQEGKGDRLTQWGCGGMSSILRILMGTHVYSPWRGLGVGKKVKLQTRVANIDWSDGEAKVITESGLMYQADFVIFTASLNVLKKKHKFLFHPQLPQPKLDAINALGMDVVDKIYIVFKEKWWPDDIVAFNPLQDSKFPRHTEDWEREIAFFVDDGNPHVLGVWVNGASAKRMEKDTVGEVKLAVMKTLNTHVGSKYKIPEPLFIVRSRWWDNMDIIGSYSYNSVASESLSDPRTTLADPLNCTGKPVVLFAGEATSRHHFSTVNGAIESGWREAQRIIDYLKKIESD